MEAGVCIRLNSVSNDISHCSVVDRNRTVMVRVAAAARLGVTSNVSWRLSCTASHTIYCGVGVACILEWQRMPIRFCCREYFFRIFIENPYSR